MIVVPPSSSPALSAHKRTPSEADRWLDEVTKSVRAPQPNPIMAAAVAASPPTQQFTPPVAAIPVAPVGAPVPFMSPLPPAVPLLPPRQPAFHAPAPAASYPVTNGLPFPQPSVPVVGITPSQMVANVFGSATQPQPFPVPASTTPQHDVQAAVGSVSPFIKPPPQCGIMNPVHLQPSNGSVTFNGGAVDSWAAAPSQLAPSSPAMQPLQPPPAPPQEDAFEAQWAALEGRSRQRTTPSPTNPFSTELHKTFEIQL